MIDQTRHSAQRRVAAAAEPPDGVRLELLWRLAKRLHREHRVAAPSPSVPLCGTTWAAWEGAEKCRACGQPWPCSGRRLAELGLDTASP